MNHLEEFEFNFWMEQLSIIFYLMNVRYTLFSTLTLTVILLLNEINACSTILSGTFQLTLDYVSLFSSRNQRIRNTMFMHI